MKLLRSLTFRLALYYAGLFTLSVLLLGALYYVIAIWAPLESVERGLAAEARELASLRERDGLAALAAALERRRLPRHLPERERRQRRARGHFRDPSPHRRSLPGSTRGLARLMG